MIDPGQVAFFVPPGLKRFKLDLFERIGREIKALGGKIIRHHYAELVDVVPKRIPIVGCSPPFASAIAEWQRTGARWIYWDRGYLRRVFATWLPRGSDMGIPGGYYRWHLNGFQMAQLRDVPADRWKALRLDASVKPWHRHGGYKIVIANTLPDYWQLRGLPLDWCEQTRAQLERITKRPIIIRDKESKRPLYDELEGAHCLVTHGSIAAVEAAIMGTPVFVDASSAAALVGRTSLDEIEQPMFPDRERWLHSLAYCQFNERELCDGTLWRLIE